ncbi:transposase, partial [Romboutsia sp.]|uniref:transposase n=1 Tax=Romboutsia sp. TaxID=1965302 RepID=UPI003F3DB0A7
QGQLYSMSKKTKDFYNVDELEVLADKGYYDSNDIAKCDSEKIVTYIYKPVFSNKIGDSRYFSNKFKYDKETDTYTCPEGKTLFLKTKKVDAKSKKYMNQDACNNCINRNKCTSSKTGRSITRDENSDVIDNMVDRINSDKTKYSQRKSIVEHPFGTLKRSMNFTYLLLRNLEKVKGEVSLAFFSYNLKRVINILGVKEIIASLCAILYRLKIELDYIFYNLAQN